MMEILLAHYDYANKIYFIVVLLHKDYIEFSNESFHAYSLYLKGEKVDFEFRCIKHWMG